VKDFVNRYLCFVLMGVLTNGLFGFDLSSWETWVFIIAVSISFEIRLVQILKDQSEDEA